MADSPDPAKAPLLERVDVDAGSALCGDHLRQIEREPVGVVQLERQLPGDPLAARQLLAEDGAAAIERAQEQIGLVLDGIQDADAGIHQLGIRASHDLDHLCADPGVEGRFGREPLGMPDRAAQDSPQHVTAPFVRRQDPVRQQERGRARVIGDHAHRGRGTARVDGLGR